MLNLQKSSRTKGIGESEGTCRWQQLYSGDGMCIGWDSGDAVTNLYKTPGRFTGGTIQGVAVDTGKESYEDMELEAKRLLMKH